jgi:hypothetical protein
MTPPALRGPSGFWLANSLSLGMVAVGLLAYLRVIQAARSAANSAFEQAAGGEQIVIAGIDQAGHAGRFVGPAQQETLHLVAMQQLQFAQLPFRLHALGHHLHLQRMRQRDDGGHDGAAGVIVQVQARGEEAIDLDLPAVELRQVGQAGIAGAEIIDGDIESQRLQLRTTRVVRSTSFMAAVSVISNMSRCGAIRLR